MSNALKRAIDGAYLIEKRREPNIEFQVYGAVIIRTVFWRFISQICYIYCANDRVYYKSSGVTEDISSNIKKLIIRRSIFNKKIIRLKIKNDKTHRLTIYEYDSLITDITGSQPQHCRELIDVLSKKCLANRGTLKNKVKIRNKR
ncbi:MAG: hypothetical protein J6B60_06160 [Clostridia bacterium]|nr:hypothetical protein [Clostridia bacterium]